MNTRARIVTLTVTVLMATCAGQAAAATLTVTTFNDLSGRSDGRCSLREAIAAVNSPGTSGNDCKPAAFGANTIVVPVGTYPVVTHFDPAKRDPGELMIASTVTRLTIAGAGETKTIIAAGDAFVDRLLKVSAGATVTIKNLTLRGGMAQIGSNGTDGSGTGGEQGANGGAILNDGTLRLIDATVDGCRAGDGGSGGDGAGSGSTGGPGGDGGAGGSGGAIYNTGDLTLQGSLIVGNDGGGGGGGGQGGSGTSAGGLGGSGGQGGEGGGVANIGGTLVVVDSTFIGNEPGAGGSAGPGGVAPAGGAGGDGGSGAGGGAILSAGGTLVITNSTFASNAASNGGMGGAGIVAAEGSGGTSGSAGNGGAGGSGGAISVVGVGSSSLQSVTIAGNVSGFGGLPVPLGFGSPAGTRGPDGTGGGIAGQGTVPSMQNSLLASNYGGNCVGPVIDSGHNLSFAGSGCPATFASGDANLGPIQLNGGPAQTISLAPGSAAIDEVPSTGAGCPATDERGVHRPTGSGCDIGAYEVAPPTVSTGRARSVAATGATLTASVTPNAGVASVQFQFGTSKKYKSMTAVQHIGGVVPVTVTAKLGHLRQRTTYHYRVTIVALDGTSKGRDRTFKTTNRPTLTGLSVKPGTFRASGPGAMIAYSDTEAATTTFTVLRCTKPLARGARCARFVKVGSFSHRDRAGHNKVALRARIGRRTLSPGIYELKARARAGRKTGNTVTAKFAIRA